MRFIYIILFLLLPTSVFSQVTIISENFGTTLGLTIPVNSYTGYQNLNTLSYTGNSSIRNTLPSTGYAGSSGLGNVFFNTNQQLTIRNINTLCFANVTLSLGIYKSTRLSNGSDFVIEYSTDGITYTQLPYFLPTGDLTAIWRSITLINFLPSVENLTIRFRQTGTTTQFRIDDINISGIQIPFDTTRIELRNCNSFTWDGVSYDIDSIYIFNRKTYQGCDSIIAVDFIKDINNIGCVLPVVLSSFTSKCINESIEINWTTVSEINNDYFELEKFNESINNWNVIGSILGNGNSNREINYKYSDFNVESINIYRLKSISYTGVIEYSKPIEADCIANFNEYIYFDLYGRTIDILLPDMLYIQYNKNAKTSKLILQKIW